MEDKKKLNKISRLKKQQKLFDFLSEHLMTIKSIEFICVVGGLICYNLITGQIGVLGIVVGGISLIDYLFENVTYYGTDLCFDISEKIKEKISKECGKTEPTIESVYNKVEDKKSEISKHCNNKALSKNVKTSSKGEEFEIEKE